ncbi:MAG: hypothetical protein KZQ73_12735, partial [Candidatus Thiodiazotropha sp. (ex Semelilucina semeliformis)]|nr:hypothetical protein [Candidatus Thiodiazotropha sp. (ex Semelilucina semeliformis)]
MKCCVAFLSVSILLSCIVPINAYAGDDDADGSSTLDQRRALSNRIKQLRQLRKQLPIPVPAGLFGIYAFTERG